VTTPNLAPEALLNALAWRYATKQFDPNRKIPVDLWQTLEKSLLLSPSSFGLQPWRFVVVTDTALKLKLKGKAWNQPQVADCSHFVVLAGRTAVTEAEIARFIKSTATARGIPEEKLADYKGMMTGMLLAPGFPVVEWAARQVYIALGFLLESAAVLGVDACPMEGFDHKAFDEILGLPAEGYTAQVAAALGYRSAADKYAGLAKVRYGTQDLIRHIG
jgi:nitroreductase